MQRTDFAICLNRYLTDYMVNDRGSTACTIASYRYAFIALLEYYTANLGIQADRICLKDITYDRIIGFYRWIQEDQKNSIATRNHRQSAINSFIKYLMYERPEYMPEYQRITSIPIKKFPMKEISYLKEDGVRLLMEQIPIEATNGLRDYVMLMLMYTTGIRVSELISIKVRDLSLSSPYTLLVHGKGQRSRFVPLISKTVSVIKRYLCEMGYDNHSRMDDWLFVNHMGGQFTRQGVSYLIKKYADTARKISPDLIPVDMSPHKMRHTAAMGLVASGVDLIYIRDLLGHVSVRTTEVYAKADAKHKREAIEAASKELVPKEEAKWDDNVSLRNWLKDFCKTR